MRIPVNECESTIRTLCKLLCGRLLGKSDDAAGAWYLILTRNRNLTNCQLSQRACSSPGAVVDIEIRRQRRTRLLSVRGNDGTNIMSLTARSSFESYWRTCQMAFFDGCRYIGRCAESSCHGRNALLVCLRYLLSEPSPENTCECAEQTLSRTPTSHQGERSVNAVKQMHLLPRAFVHASFLALLVVQAGPLLLDRGWCSSLLGRMR